MFVHLTACFNTKNFTHFFNYISMIFINEGLGNTFFLITKCLKTFSCANINSLKRTIHHYQVKNASFITMNHMNMYGFMLIRIEVKYLTEIFKNLWHFTLVLFHHKNTLNRLHSKILPL